jgi:hypothetical protein
MNEMAEIYVARGVRIAQNLGLFDEETHNQQRLDPTNRKRWKGRAIIAWGLFNWQTYGHFPFLVC